MIIVHGSIVYEEVCRFPCRCSALGGYNAPAQQKFGRQADTTLYVGRLRESPGQTQSSSEQRDGRGTSAKGQEKKMIKDKVTCTSESLSLPTR